MARLYRPKIVEYRLPDGSYRMPDGKRVTKDTPGAVKSSRPSKKWYGRYTDGAGRPLRVPLSESKETSRRVLAKIAGDAQLAGVGIADPFALHRSRPLLDHLEDFRRYLEAKGNTAEHVAKTCSRIRAVIDECPFRTLDDLEAPPVVEMLGRLKERARPRRELDPAKNWYTRAELAAALGIHMGSVSRMLGRAGLKGQGQGRARRYSQEVVKSLQDCLCQATAATTCNHYLTAIKAFTRWLARNRRMGADPLAYLARQNVEVNLRHERRALRSELFERFIEATAAGKTFRGLTGADRLVLYTLAAHTGFRAKELGSLEPASIDLASETPTVTVLAAYSKRRRKDVQPLRADVAEMMRQYVTAKPCHAKLWPGTWTKVAAEMIRADLAAAGIPYQDDSGRYFDFHAMRGQFISLLAASGVHPKVAQALARHSTITLTRDFYTHLDVLDVAGALERLPGLPGGQGAAKAPPSKQPRQG
jgi:integrase